MVAINNNNEAISEGSAEASAEASAESEGIDYAKYAAEEAVESTNEEVNEEGEAEKQSEVKAEIDIDKLKEYAAKNDVESALEALGFDPKAIKKSDFVVLRHKERAMREKIEARKREADEKLHIANSKLAEHEQVISGVSQAYELLKQGDRIGFIEKLTGESWEDYVAAATVHASDPALARVKQLEKQLEQRQSEEARKREQLEHENESLAQRQAQESWINEISETLASSNDLKLVQISKRPNYINQIFEIQKDAYHRTGKAMGHIEAAKVLISNIEKVASEFIEKPKVQQAKISKAVSAPGSTREMTAEERWKYYASM
jgi:hypothetical protein